MVEENEKKDENNEGSDLWGSIMESQMAEEVEEEKFLDCVVLGKGRRWQMMGLKIWGMVWLLTSSTKAFFRALIFNLKSMKSFPSRLVLGWLVRERE